MYEISNSDSDITIIKNLNLVLKEFIGIIIICIYIIVIIILFINVIYSLYLYSKTKNINNKFRTNLFIYNKAKIILEEGISYSLTFILLAEILKLLYIKSFHNLLFIACIIILKIILNTFLDKILQRDYEKTNIIKGTDIKINKQIKKFL